MNMSEMRVKIEIAESVILRELQNLSDAGDLSELDVYMKTFIDQPMGGKPRVVVADVSIKASL